MTKKSFLQVTVAVLIAQSAGIIGSAFTAPAIRGWYRILEKPVLTPPSWLFGPVWITLYTLMGIAAFLIWKKGWEKRKVKIALSVFLFQLVLNALWSILFFGLKRVDLALIDISVLWASIVVMIVLFGRLSKPAAYLLIPYLLWVSFASYLNYAILVLN